MEFVWDIYPGFTVGGVGIRWYSVIYSVTLVACWGLMIWQIRRGGGEEREANWLTAACIFAVFVGGRLGHLVFYEFDRLVADPAVLWRFREGGIASHGSTFALLLVVATFARIRRVPVLEVFDRTSIAVALAAATIRIGNLFNSEVVGRVTDQSWGVRFPYYDRMKELSPLRHPSQIYEFVMGFAIFLAMLAVDRKLGESRPRGFLFGMFMALYFTGRFVVEFFKEYQTLSPDAPLTMGQWLSIPLAAVGWWTWGRAWRRREPAGWSSAPSESG